MAHKPSEAEVGATAALVEIDTLIRSVAAKAAIYATSEAALDRSVLEQAANALEVAAGSIELQGRMRRQINALQAAAGPYLKEVRAVMALADDPPKERHRGGRSDDRP